MANTETLMNLRALRLDLLYTVAAILTFIFVTNLQSIYSQNLATKIEQAKLAQQQQSQQYNVQNTTGYNLTPQGDSQNNDNPFSYMDTAKEDTQEAFRQQSKVDLRFFQRPFLATSRPLSNENIAINVPYTINWKKDKTIPIDIRSFVVYIGKGNPQQFQRMSYLTEVKANSRQYTPITFTVPDNFQEGTYTLEYIGYLEPGDALVGPQYSQPFQLTRNKPGVTTRMSNSIRQRLPGASGTVV